MRERPIQDLVDGLTQLGVDAQCTAGTGCPPVAVHAQGLPSGKVRHMRTGELMSVLLYSVSMLVLVRSRRILRVFGTQSFTYLQEDVIFERLPSQTYVCISADN